MSVVSQFLQSPYDNHWDVVVRILRYIKGTLGQGVLYENRGHTQVVGYSDADWVGSSTDRRSISGYCVFVLGNLISWNGINMGRYLGLPSLIGRSKRATFSYIKDTIWKRIQGWRNKLLSQAGKGVLIKSVAQAIPTYSMSVFRLPISVVMRFEK